MQKRGPFRLNGLGTAAILLTVAGMTSLAPAQAETLSVVCSLSQDAQAQLTSAGYPQNAQTQIHLQIDTDAGTASDYATYPGQTDNPTPVVYQATTTDQMITWSTPPDEDDGSVATRSLNRETHVLNTVDPDGVSTLWYCN